MKYKRRVLYRILRFSFTVANVAIVQGMSTIEVALERRGELPAGATRLASAGAIVFNCLVI
jgi:hypothetical protein